jgi:hypothetical protein
MEKIENEKIHVGHAPFCGGVVFMVSIQPGGGHP